MGNNGSITILLALLLPCWILLAGVVLDQTRGFHAYRSFVRGHQLELAASFRRFDRGLFERFGLLGVSCADGPVMGSDPLEDSAVLKGQVLALMTPRSVSGWVDRLKVLEDSPVLNEMRRLKARVAQTLSLKEAINRQVLGGKIPSQADLGRLVSGIIRDLPCYRFPYDRPQDLFDLGDGILIELELREELAAVGWGLSQMVSPLEGVPGFDRWVVADYTVHYLGYSINQSASRTDSAEYVLTGLPVSALRTTVVMAHLGLLRTLFDLVDIAADPERMQTLLVEAGGDPRVQMSLMLVEAARQATAEVSRLRKGKAIPLIADQELLMADYATHLTLLLAMMPEMTVLSRLGSAIGRVSGCDLRALHTRLTIEGSFRYPYRFGGGVHEESRHFEIAF